MRIILAVVALIVTVVILASCCGHKPSQDVPPDIKAQTNTTTKNSDKKNCIDGKCR